MTGTIIEKPKTLTSDSVVGESGTPSAGAPASSEWLAEVAAKALNKDTSVLPDLDDAVPTDTNKVPNAADTKEKLDKKLDKALTNAASKVIVTDADGNIIASADVSLDKLKAVGALSTDGAIVAVDAEGKVSETSLTKTKAEALQALATKGAVVVVGEDGQLIETGLTFTATDENGTEVNRLSQTAAPASTASAETDMLTKKDADGLYQPIGAALEGITLPSRGIHTLEPDEDEDTKIFEFDTLAPLTGGTPTTVSVYASTGGDQVEFYLSSRVPYFAKFQGTKAVTTRTNGEVTASEVSVVCSAARRWTSATAGHATAQTLTTSSFNREDCVSLIMQFGKGGGSVHNFTCACQIELTPVDSGQMNSYGDAAIG
ncbi:hypothetical protein [Vibrio phage VP16C]|nr:hypothetical protein [Vibrio phage VP16C]